MQSSGVVLPHPPPAACPGTSTGDAGRSAACAGCPNQSVCASGERPPADPAVAEIAARLRGVRHKVLVLSGKGGVGKSTVTAALAYALTTAVDANANEAEGEGAESLAQHVGVLDIDITGPSMPRLLGVSGETVHQSADGWCPVAVDDAISVMSIAFMLPSADDAVIWRGPKKTAMIKQFLRDVDWGPLDVLLVDTPPGTSDEHIAAVQFLHDAGIDGAVVVATPQEVALQDVRKELSFCRKIGLRVLGVVENMSAYVCPNCAHSEPIFATPAGTAGVTDMCRAFDVPYLGAVPLDPRIARACDAGQSFIDLHRDSPAAIAYMEIVAAVADSIGLSTTVRP